MSISSATIKNDIWNIFNTLIKANVTSVTIKGSGGANTKTVTVKSISQEFPDKIFDSETNYPIITIASPTFNSSPVTFRERELDCKIEFNIFTLQSESADKFNDAIVNTIFTNESTLSIDGIDELEIDSTDSNNYDRNGLNVHARMLVFRFRVGI